jgi:hypothetical protein
MGTTEHLASPVLGLAFMHYACKVGGAMFTDTPIFGWGNHGLANMTPKFWHLLRITNGYRIVICRLRDNDESPWDPGNFYHEDMAYMERLKEARNLSWMIRFVVLKPADRAFLPPFDAILPQSGGSKEAEILKGVIRPFLLAGIWTEREAAEAINDAIERRAQPFRLPLDPPSRSHFRLFRDWRRATRRA